MQQPQQVQTHHQIVEEILPEQMSDEVTKEVINQFLPQRKRKPRVPKSSGKQNPAKIIKLEPQASGSDTITTITNLAEPTDEEMIVEKQEQVTEMIEQVGEEQAEQSSTDVKVKGEGKASKDKSNSECWLQHAQLDGISHKNIFLSEPKSKSQSEQPATCPICSATIRQSRNLRRHLELRHFKKRTPKKLKKEMANGELCNRSFSWAQILIKEIFSSFQLNSQTHQRKSYRTMATATTQSPSQWNQDQTSKPSQLMASKRDNSTS